MAAKKQTPAAQVNTQGGAYTAGNVNTGGGDFVGRDKHSGGGTSISVGGSVNGAIVVGNGNTITNTVTQNVFAPVYRAIEQSDLPAQAKADVRADVQEIEAAALTKGTVDETFLARRLRNLKRMAPEIGEVALAAISSPGAALALVVKKVAERVKTEA